MNRTNGNPGGPEAGKPQTGRPQEQVSAFALFLVFLRIGFFTLGGGLAMIGVMRHELVIRKKWLKEDNFLNMVSFATSVPGAVAVNIAYLIGKQFAGFRGAGASLAGVLLPSFTVILLVVQFLYAWFTLPVIRHFFTGAAVAVTALIAFSTWLYGRSIITDPYSILITVLLLLLLFLFNLHPLLVILLSAGLRYFLPERKAGPLP